MSIKIALAGVPNCGKTTLFNLVTGRRRKTGNWPGVTTEKISAPLKIQAKTELIDLPGTYSLESGSEEEKIAGNYIKSKKADSVIIVIDGTKPEQGIYLALNILSSGVPAVIGINYCDLLRAQNISVDIALLKEEFSVPVFLFSAKTGENVHSLFSSAINQIKNGPQKISSIPTVSYRKKAAFLAEKGFIKKENIKRNTVPYIFSLLFLVAVSLLSVPLVSVLKSSVNIFFEHVIGLSSALMSKIGVSSMLISLLAEGLLPGIHSLLLFVPELFAVFFLLSFLEDCGFMARFAFLTDYVFKKLGLSGKAAIPLVLGFGCTVPAAYAAKATGSFADATRTLSALMFIPCSARLPLLLLICETFFPGKVFVSVLIFYFTVFFIGCVFFMLNKKVLKTDFILEIPSFRIPSIKSILKSVSYRLGSFLSKAGAVVVLTSVLIWILQNFSLFGEPVLLKSDSALFSMGSLLYPFFSLTGIPFEGITALFFGLFAKESALFALLSLCGDVSAVFSSFSAVSFILFYLIYPPCLSCLFVISKEFGLKKAAWLFIRQTAFAYFISFSFYQISLLFQRFFIP